MAILFDDTGYLLGPLTKEQYEKMDKMFQEMKKYNTEIKIFWPKREPYNISERVQKALNEAIKNVR